MNVCSQRSTSIRAHLQTMSGSRPSRRFLHFSSKETMGSMQSSEHFCQVTNNGRLADIHSEIFETPTINGCFSQEQTFAKIWATTAVRTKQTSENARLTLSDRHVRIIGTLRVLREWSTDGRDQQRTNKAYESRSKHSGRSAATSSRP